MRGKQRSLLVGFVLWTVATSAFAQGGIRWASNLDDARHVARRDGRLILLHFYADWCGPCRKLDREVFPRTDVGAAILRDYVPVKIDGDRARDIAKYHEVDRYPTDIITNASGKVLYRTVTPQDPLKYVQLLNSVARDNRYANPNVAMAPQNAPRGSSQFSSDRWNRSSDPRDANRSHSAYPPSQREPASTASYDRSPPYRGADYGPGPAHGGQAAANPYARQPQSRAGYADQYPRGVHPPAVAGTRPQSGLPPQGPRETYNSHAPPWSGPRSSPRMDDYGRGGQPPVDVGNNGWKPRTAGHTSQGQQRANVDAGQPYGNARPPIDHSRQRFASSPITPPPQEPPLALDGFCPVTLQEGDNWRRGDTQWGAIHRGRTYLFASQKHQQRFMADPDRFSPVLSGYDPVRYIDGGEAAPGSREHGIWFGGKIFLFSNEPTLERFRRSPEYYAQRAHEMMMRARR